MDSTYAQHTYLGFQYCTQFWSSASQIVGRFQVVYRIGKAYIMCCTCIRFGACMRMAKYLYKYAKVTTNPARRMT